MKRERRVSFVMFLFLCSFCVCLSVCFIQTARSRDDFTVFMCDLESVTPLLTRRGSDVGAATSTTSGRSLLHQGRSSVTTATTAPAAAQAPVRRAETTPPSFVAATTTVTTPATAAGVDLVAATTGGEAETNNLLNPSPESDVIPTEERASSASLDDDLLIAQKLQQRAGLSNGNGVALSNVNSLSTSPLQVEDANEWLPDFNVMRPLSASTLELHFPQLASFDLYLHSEIE